jgi:hypothetical protein
MKKGEIFERFINEPDKMRGFERLSDRYLFLLAIAYCEDPKRFRILEGLTWNSGHAVLISKSERKIINTQKSAVVREIFRSPYFAEVGHGKEAFLRLLDIILRKLQYGPGLKNEIKQLLMPVREDLVARLLL